MPKLDCSVVNCRYNEDYGCVRSNISVGGASAQNSSETRCDSFEERRGDYARNSTAGPSARLNVRCEAKKCVHNDNCTCEAEKIDVAGANACRCGDTLCGTFYQK